jgi:serine/threonine-protein kinase
MSEYFATIRAATSEGLDSKPIHDAAGADPSRPRLRPRSDSTGRRGDVTTVMSDPQTVGKYRITSLIGEGPSGAVYKAFDTELHRVVAVKVLRGFVPGDIEPAEAFAGRLAEHVQAVSRLAHPGIVAVHEVGEAGGRPYVAMEFVGGMELGQWLAATPLPPLPLLLQVMDQLLDALEAVHRAGARHGDIKPTNVLITGSGAIKITDFGLARCEGRSGERAGVAPEYLSGRLIDHRVDVYAAGCIFYRMLAGREPYTDDLAWTTTESLGATVRPPSTIGEAGRPSAFDGVVVRAMAHEPGQRYASAAEFRDALREATQDRVPVHGSDSVTVSPAERAAAAAAQQRQSGKPVPSGDAAAGLPVLTIAIPDSVLTMPAYDPWAAQPGAEGADQDDDDDDGETVSGVLSSDDATFAPLDAAAGARRKSDAAVAAAHAAVSAAAVAAEAARVRASVRLASLSLPPAPPPAGPVVVTRSIDQPEPPRDPYGVLAPAPERLKDGDLQLPHPVEGEQIPAEALRRVLRVLSAHFGDLAGDILKQVAGRARTIPELHALLLEQAGAGVDKKKLAKQLKAVAKMPL